MIISIHQPTLLPYFGVLEKVRQSDVFIVLSHAQFERGNYQNRFKHKGMWYTLSVNQALRPLAEKVYTRPVEDWLKIKSRLPDYTDVLEEFDEMIVPGLVETNVAILRRTCELLNIKTRIVLDYPSSLTKTARLVDLCKRHGATEYLSGPSGVKYLDEQLFHDAGIGVRYQMQQEVKSAIDVLKEKL